MSIVLTAILYFVLSTLSTTKKYTSLFNKRRGLNTADTLSKTDSKSLLNQTNYFRAQVATGSFKSSLTKTNLPSATTKLIPLLLWDDGLAASSASVADKCKAESSNTTTSDLKTNKLVNATFQLPVNSRLLGENLAKLTMTSSDETKPNIQTLLTMVKDWIDEGKQYKYSEFSPDSNTEYGHFTQIIWSKTKYVGCGFKFCDNETPPTILLVCQYYPRGNVKGQYPYDVTEDNTICVSVEAQKTAKAPTKTPTKIPTETPTKTPTKIPTRSPTTSPTAPTVNTPAANAETEIVSVDTIIGEYSLDNGMYVKNGSNTKIYWDENKQWNIGNIAICSETQLENSIPVDCSKYVISNVYTSTIKSISISGGKCEKKSDNECVYKGVKCYLWYIIISATVFVVLLFVIAMSACIYICVKRNMKIEEIDDNNELDEEKSMLPAKTPIEAKIVMERFGISDVDHQEMIKIKADMSIGLEDSEED